MCKPQVIYYANIIPNIEIIVLNFICIIISILIYLFSFFLNHKINFKLKKYSANTIVLHIQTMLYNI
jgi:hypothetical protein